MSLRDPFSLAKASGLPLVPGINLDHVSGNSTMIDEKFEDWAR